MKKIDSAYYVAILATGLSADELPIDNRSERWWDLFWQYLGWEVAREINENHYNKNRR